MCSVGIVHLTFPPHICSVQVKSGACYITGQWGRVQNKKNNLTLTLTLALNLLLSSIVFHDKICVFHMILTVILFLRLIYGLSFI